MRIHGINLALCASFMLTTMCVNAQISDRLVGWWKMDEAPGATTLVDSSGYGRHATLGAGASIIDGRFGKALLFDGSSDAWAGFNNPSSLTNFTLSAWVKVTSFTNSYPKMFQMGQCYYQFETGNPGRFRLGIGTTPLGHWLSDGTDPFIAGTDKWLHTAVVIKREYINETEWVAQPIFYINGVRCGGLQTPKTYSPDAAESDYGYLGNTGPGGQRAFNGAMDDVRIYDQALSDREILDVYQNCPVAANAGTDQRVHRNTATLQGRLSSTNPYSAAINATSLWSVIASPAGELPLFTHPTLPATEVTLPEDGTYIFRLTAVSEQGVSSNDVTIVNDSGDATGNVAPVVTLPWSAVDAVLGQGMALTGVVTDDGIPSTTPSVCWSKVSGAGGVFFDNAFTNTTTAYFSTNGTYLLQLAADDGAAIGSDQVTVNVMLPVGDLSAGLEHAWKMNDDPSLKKAFDSAGSNTLTLANQAFLQPGKTGYGYRGPTLDSVGIGSQVLTNANCMTFSAWFYFDAAYVQGASGNQYQRLYKCGPNFYILYNTPLNRLYMSTRGVGTGNIDYNWSWNAELTPNTWIHLSVLFDRSAAASGSRQVMYVNGHKFMSNALNTAFPGAADFTSPFLIANTGTSNGTRNFDGVLDEMRVYSRFITDEEALLLAVDPDNNHAPVIEVPTSLKAKAGFATALAGQVFDDGQPVGSTLVSKWSVVSGNPAHVVFADASAPDSNVTFARSGDYELILTVSDGELKSATLVNVTVVTTGILILVN